MSACEKVWKNTLVKMSGNSYCIGPVGPTGPSSAATENYTGTGFFGPGFPNAGTTTPDTMPIGDAITLLRQPNTFYPTQFGLGIYEGQNYEDVVMLGAHNDSESTGPNSASGCVSIGNLAGYTNQLDDSIAIGYQAGYCGQQAISVAIGLLAGYGFQLENAIGIGYNSQYQFSQGIAIGTYAGFEGQETNAIGIGLISGALGQRQGAISIGPGCQTYNAEDNSHSIAIGSSAGYTSQNYYSIAIGESAGNEAQGQNSIAIGTEAGLLNQGSGAIAIGYNAGYSNQSGAIGIGWEAGTYNQGGDSIAIGENAGTYDQSTQCVAIGLQAGYTSQGQYAVAIGYQAGFVSQGINSLAIGNFAGVNNQAPDSIIINATGSELDNTISNSCVIAPIRNVSGSNDPFLFYDDTTSELTYGIPPSTKTRKNNITSLDESIVNKLLQLEPVSFKYKNKNNLNYGLISEQVYDILPDIVIQHPISGEIESLDYTQLIGPIIKLIQTNHMLLEQNQIILSQCVQV